MSTYWIDTNLSFEYALASRSSEKVDRFTKPWADLLRLLPGFENAEQFNASADFGPDDKLEVWGVLDGHRENFPDRFPKASIINNANSKLWSFENRKEGLSYSAIVSSESSLEDLRLALGQTPKWILKDPFGVAGRERFNGDVSTEIENVFRWMKKRGGDFLLESYVDIEFEFSTHYSILDEGEIKYEGVCAILCESNGGFRGNFPLPIMHQGRAAEARNSHWMTLEKLRDLGYRGPLSIDSFFGRDAEQYCFQTLSEINARYTFGRMFIELQKRLDYDDIFWWHPSPRVFKTLNASSITAKQVYFPVESLNQTTSLILTPSADALKNVSALTSTQ